MFGDWWDIVEFFSIQTLINFVLQGCSEDEFKVFMSERFNKALHVSACSPNVFDDTATVTLLLLIKKYHKSQTQVYMMVKSYVYHTYMVLYHKINRDDEFRLLNYKLRRFDDPTATY